MSNLLKFSTFSSDIELPFYSALFSSKLDHDKLDDSARPMLGLYEARAADDPDDSTRMRILGSALTSNTTPLGSIRAEGMIKNVNTIEDFKNLDKAAMLQMAGRQIWDAIKDGTIYSVPSLLSSFTVLSFADLKKYKFTYWFAFPALHSDPQWRRTGPIGRFNSRESTALVERVGTWRYMVDAREHGFFLAKKVRGPEGNDIPKSSVEYGPDSEQLAYRWEVGSLSDFETGFFASTPAEDRYVCFVDPSTYPENPGWPLRNLLVLVRQRFKWTNAQILCYRDVQARRDEARSIILNISMGDISPEDIESTEMPKVTGWERNTQGRLSPRIANLAEYMDPARLADQSVDLNLKLMKWRISPNLDLDAIKNTRCLLLGAGTLGGYVSRNLLGWGVRKITLVDNGAVSFSNPVRQPLFTFDDCLGGGAPKAPRAAESLKAIYPGVDAKGHVLSVPMLGHSVMDENKSKADFEKLRQLIADHDAVFLLMDTRESRWLPTVMAKAAGKIVMNAALGFDTYVVMRHGASPKDGSDATLGCYFCNDVVAPADSIKDQTLDQQCTVTRPGVAAIASALLVELLASVLQHPDKQHAPAPPTFTSTSSPPPRDPPDHALGLVPHQIRGFLANFASLNIRGESYPNCSACSRPILDAYKSGGWEFVKKALDDRDYVTELSGLAEIQRRAEELAASIEWSEGDEDDGAEGDADADAVLL